MKTNIINDQIKHLVKGIHDELRASNPTLTDVRRELKSRAGFDLTETELGDFILEAGRQRGYSSTADKANTASRLAAQAAFHAATNKTKQSHLIALQAHMDASRLHRAAAGYHDSQTDWHRSMADSCQARRSPVLSAAELEARQIIEAEKQSEFKDQRCHCSSCGCDFKIENAKQNSAENYFCPTCGTNTNVSASKKEDFDENQEPADAGRAPWAWLGQSFEQMEAGKEPEFQNQDVHQESASAARANGDADGAELDCELSAARSYIGGDATLPDWIPFMPGGTHRITPSQAGRPVTVVVQVNELAAERLEQQRKTLEATTGNKPFFSIQHDSQVAAFWPTKFIWATRKDANGQPVTGIWADGEWSKSGREAVEGKDFRTFSPVFHVDKIRNDEDNPAQIICNSHAKLNMGAVLCDPAFDKMPPLWT